MDKARGTAFLKGTLLLSISVVVTKVIGVAFKVPLSYVLGDEGMGYFNTAYAIYGFFYILCTAGVPKSITLVLTGHGGEIDGENSSRYVIRCALRLFLLIGAFATSINIVCAPALARFIGNKNALLSIWAISPSILFVSLSGVLRGYLNSNEKLYGIAVSQLLEGLIKLSCGLLLAFFGVKLNASVSVISALAISGITLGSIISFLYLIFASFSNNKQENTGQKCDFNSRNIKRSILKNALPIALCSSLLNLSSTLDLTIIIKRLVESGKSEIYANSLYGNYTTLAVPMFTLVISVLSPLATSYMPRLSTLAVKGDNSAFSSELRKLLAITALISVPASLAFYFYSFDLLDVLFSVQSSAIGADMLICLSLGVCLLTVLTVVNTALESRGRIVVTVISLLAGAVTKLVVSYLLIGKSNVGILGAPLGTVISYAVSLLISLIALEFSGIRSLALKMCLFIYMLGIVCFYPSYKLIYSTGAFATSFVSMLVSLVISCTFYGIAVLLSFFIFGRKRMSILHKKAHVDL